MSFLSKIVFICYFSFEKLLEKCYESGKKNPLCFQCNISIILINNRRYIGILGVAVAGIVDTFTIIAIRRCCAWHGFRCLLLEISKQWLSIRSTEWTNYYGVHASALYALQIAPFSHCNCSMFNLSCAGKR